MLFGGIGAVRPAATAWCVAPASQLPDERLRHVLDRGEAADRVAVDRRVADGELALVARGQHEVSLRVGQRHQRRAAHAGLQVLLRESGQVQRALVGVDHRRDRDGADVHSGARGEVVGVGDGVLGGVDARHRHAVAPAPARGRRRRWPRRARSRCRRSGPGAPIGSRSSRRSREGPGRGRRRPRPASRAGSPPRPVAGCGSSGSTSTTIRAGSNCGARASTVPSGATTRESPSKTSSSWPPTRFT